MRHLLFVLALLAAALSAGFFYTFSTTVIPGLAEAGAVPAIQAMQGINIAVRTPLFAAVFFGTLVLALLAALAARSAGHRGASRLAVLGAVIHAGAVIGVTLQVNVPLNETLATVLVGDANAAATWGHFAEPWAFWNHVRTAGAIVTFLCLLAAYAVDLTSTGRRMMGLR